MCSNFTLAMFFQDFFELGLKGKFHLRELVDLPDKVTTRRAHWFKGRRLMLSRIQLETQTRAGAVRLKGIRMRQLGVKTCFPAACG